MEEKSVCVVDSLGTKRWYLNGTLHREDDLPAIEGIEGNKIWWLNGKCHRIKGPAIEYISGIKFWYLNGELIDCRSQKEFVYYLKYKAFL